MTPRDITIANSSKPQVIVAERMFDTQRKTWRHLLLRGGRATKYKGIAGGIAPQSANFISTVLRAAAVSAFAFGGIVFSTSTTLAGTCAVTAGAWLCSDPAGADDTQTISENTPVSVTTEPMFGINVTSGTAIEIEGDGGVSFIDENGSKITGGVRGLNLWNNDTGELYVRSNGEITGGGDAISATQNGADALTITSSGIIDGGNYGIYTQSYGTDTTINVNDVEGDNSGIASYNNGTGALHITSTGTVIGTGVDGISATNYSGTDLVIDVKDVEGASQGIATYHSGSGELRITSTGLVVGGTDAGINGTNYTGTNLIINAKDVKGGPWAIYGYNLGSGELRIKSTGYVTTDGVYGITANNINGTNLIIEANDVRGGENAIRADNMGSGKLHIVSTGLLEGLNGNGLLALNSGGDLIVDVNKVQGGGDGIHAENDGSGVLSVTARNTVEGRNGDGIYAQNYSSTDALTVAAVDVKGAINGITTVNDGTDGVTNSSSTVTVFGNIDGGSGYGINTQSADGILTTINVAKTAKIGSLADNAIFNDGGDSQVNIADGAILNGKVHLGGGMDAMNLWGGFSNMTVLDGGADIDSLALYNADTSFDGTNIKNWDVFTLANSRLALDGNLEIGVPGDVTTGVFLTNGSILDGRRNNFTLTGNMTLAAGTTFLGSADGFGTNLISGNVDNAGVISLLGDGAGDTLTIGGNYTGRDGTLLIDTVLGDDSSATDSLVIKGDTSGNTNVVVNNVDGPGDTTVEGIKIIDVEGKSKGTFSLVGDYQIDGRQTIILGAYGYTLWKNGITDPKDGDWYLRSKFFHPGVPIYETYSQVLLGMNSLPTLQQRVGNRYWNELQTRMEGTADPSGTPSIDANGIWTTVESSHARFNPRSSTSGADYDLSTWAMRAGIDGLVSETESGKLIAGLTAYHGKGNSSISSISGLGSIVTDAYGLGATTTWYGNGGFYLDGQAQATWFNSDLSSNLLGKLTSNNSGFGYALSLEGGQRLVVTENLAFIPQAQLVYSNVGFDTFTDPFDAEVRGLGSDSLRARLGLAVERQTSRTDDQGRVEHVALYGIANLQYELLDGVSTNVSGTRVNSRNEPLWTEIGLGGSYNWNGDKYSLYSEVAASSSLQDLGDSYMLNAKAGLRIRW